MVFAAPSYDHSALLDELATQCPGALVVGSSSAGEFMNQEQGEGLVSALGLAGEDVRFSVGMGRDVAGDAAGAAGQITSGFNGLSDFAFPYRSALVMADALAGHADVLIDELTLATGGQYQFFGGGAGDNAQFQRTSVFCGREVLSDAAVALEILT
ncbi:FIST N-terminal domain-containing protein [Caulobacter sp. DWP3-1-3b2]|uniref:FIST N-terminal domain-containing protein n=1 Tax=Caulobacter sp. DWP3-1-3b2 TaxID=2804643 RepID=UPI003CF6B14E